MKAIFISLLLCFCSLAVSKNLNLEELALAITEHNKRGVERITSLEDLNDWPSLIEGALSADYYRRKYKLTLGELTRQLFGNIEHLTVEELPQVIANWNLQQKADDSSHKPIIISLKQYDKYCDYIDGALSSKTYQTLYDMTYEEFLNRVFGNNKYFLSLEELPQAITEYNKHIGSKKISSFDTYKQRIAHIKGALHSGMYQVLNNMNQTEFITFVFSRVDHLTLDELPQAIGEYHNKIKASRINSLASYGRNQVNIQGTLSFKTYQMLYGITEEEFKDILKNAELGRSFTAEEIREYERQQQIHSESSSDNKNVPLLTLEETQQAIIEYNKPDAQNRHVLHSINSWFSYEKYHDRIPGTDAIRNLEEEFQEKPGVRYGFIEFLLGQKRKDLTPIELSTAIAKYNSEASLIEQIDSLEEYKIFSYRISHAPTLEVFKESARANWNDLFQEKFGTVDNYVESIIIKLACERIFEK